MDLKEADILGSDVATHWYYVSKGRAARKFLGPTRVDVALDVGAGSGVFARQLLDAGVCRRAVCVDPGYGAERIEDHNGQEIRFVRSVDRVSQKLILMMDVLEHVDDDVGLLRQYCDHMPEEGRVLITVPAFQILWSSHDTFLEHRRRYTRSGLEAAVRDADLEVLRCRYFFGLLFPIAAGLRLLERLRPAGRPIKPKSALKKYPAPFNALLTLIHDVERVAVFPFNSFFGLSVFCLARPRR